MQWTNETWLERSAAREELPKRLLLVDSDGRVQPLHGEASIHESDILLGGSAGVQWYARSAPQPVENGYEFRDQPDELVATAVMLTRWHASEPRCEVCHGPSKPSHSGQRRRCLNCGAELYCRTDPAIIVAISDMSDRLLVARNATWAVGRVSVLAGFVEPGESLEQACRREVAEEVNLAVSELQYFGSQPWPYPRSLMAAFTARVANSHQLRIDGQEIVEASFLTRQELASKVDAGLIRLPGPASIARALIDHWFNRG